MTGGDQPEAQAPGFDKHASKPGTLPYAWNGDAAFAMSVEELATGIAWYGKYFRVFLWFEGVDMVGDVRLNDHMVDQHKDRVAASGSASLMR